MSQELINVYLPLISGLVGALIGSASSLIAVWIQVSKTDKRERMKAIIDLAWREREAGYNHLKSLGKGGAVHPISAYLLYHLRLMELLEKGNVDGEKLQSLYEEIKKVSIHLDQAESKQSL